MTKLRQLSAQRDAIVAAYEAGRSTTQIAEDYGTHGCIISAFLAGAGCPTRRVGRPARNQQIRDLRAAGRSLSAIGREYGITPQRVSAITREVRA